MKRAVVVIAILGVLGFLAWQRFGGEGAPGDAPLMSAGIASGKGGDADFSSSSEASAESAPEAPPSEVDHETGRGEAADTRLPVIQREAYGIDHFRAAVQGGDVITALRRASETLVALPNGPQRKVYVTEVLSLSRTCILSARALPEFSFEHVVQSGDILDRLTRKWREQGVATVTADFVLEVNGIPDPRRLQVGQRLKIVTAQPSIVVSKSNHRLDLLYDEVIVREYAVGLGREDRTPEGDFVIESRLEKPVWFNNGEAIPYGDPRNILGTHWLGFDNRPGVVGFGIHGTHDESTIGQDLSNGCVRMRNAEVAELFDLVPKGTPVTILP